MKLPAFLAALMLAAAMAFAACGDDDDDDGANGGGDQAEAPAKPAQLSITSTAQGIEVAGTPAPGVTEITLQNDGKKPATAQLLKIEGNRSEAEIVKTFNSVADGDPFPDWLVGGGGAGVAPPGGATVAIQDLEEGRSVALNDADSPATQKSLAVFEVSGEPGDAVLPEGASTVAASEYTFETEGIVGDEPLTFENVGEEPHHIVAAPLAPGKTAKDVERFFKTEKGPPPADLDNSQATAVIFGGETVVTNLELKKPGNYVLMCFIQDLEGGPPHITKGMVSQATVE